MCVRLCGWADVKIQLLTNLVRLGEEDDNPDVHGSQQKPGGDSWRKQSDGGLNAGHVIAYQDFNAMQSAVENLEKHFSTV